MADHKQAYFTAWSLDLLLPLFLATLVLLVSSEEVRDILFPQAPRALVNTSTGGIQKPQAGQLGTSDTLTGAPEKQPGEAVEEEAAKFVDNLRHLIQRAIGMQEKEKHEGGSLEGKIPKPIKRAAKEIKGEGTATGHAEDEKGTTEKPMEEILWSKANPDVLAHIFKFVPHAIGEIVDNWERFAKYVISLPTVPRNFADEGSAISPTQPFSRLSFVRIEGVILPLFLASFFISSYMMYKGAGFAIGLGFFGNPLLTPVLAWLDRNFPKWTALLEPKK